MKDEGSIAWRRATIGIKAILGLILCLILTNHGVNAAPGDLHASPSGSGSACTLVEPCALQTALDVAESDGIGNTVYLAAGTYPGNFAYRPGSDEAKALTITGEPGTSAVDVILDGQGTGRVLELYYYSWSYKPGFEIAVRGITLENGDSRLEGHRQGGGIRAGGSWVDFTFTDNIIRDNTAEEYGGGLYVNPGGDLLMEDNLILDNTVTEAFGGTSRGAGAALYIPGTGCTLRNNVIAGNTALGSSSEGGGLFVGWATAGTRHLIGNTLYGNQAHAGGGIYFFAAWQVKAYNNIVYGNIATSGGDIYFREGYVTDRIGYNNDYSEMFGTWTESGGNVDISPGFEDPSVDDYHLQENSLLIDEGTSTVPDPPGLPDSDFEGHPRVIGVAPDIGADEFGRFTYLPLVMRSYP
jgi:hypothetical protein